MKIIFVFSSIFFLAEGTNIPSFFFQRCNKNDVNLSKCLTDSANSGWPEFVKAHKLDKIPLENVHTDIPNFVDSNLTGYSYGLEDVKFNHIYINFNKKNFDVIYTQPILMNIVNYRAKGSFLGFKIDQHGLSNFTLANGIYKNHFDYEIKERDGKEYIQLINSKLTYNIGRLYLDATNVDNPEEGVQLTNLLNNFWPIVNILSENNLAKIFADAYFPYIQEFLNKIPLDSLFEE